MQIRPNRSNLPSIRTKIQTKARVNTPSKTADRLVLANCHEIVISRAVLPVNILLQSGQYKDAVVVVGFNSISVRQQAEAVNLPWEVKDAKWVRLDLGQNISKVEVRGEQNQNKIKETCLYSSIATWRKMEGQGQTEPLSASIKQLMSMIAAKLEKQTREQLKYDVVKNIKKRKTERINSFSKHSKLSSMRERQSGISELVTAQQKGGSLRKTRKQEASSLNSRCFAQMEEKDSVARNSTASNSSGSEWQEIRLIKGPLKLRNRVQGRTVEVSPIFEDLLLEGAMAMKRAPTRPRFYEQIPYTPQEIQLKRKKFDSQCIIPKTADVTNHPLLTQQSEMMEQICLVEQSTSELCDSLLQGVEVAAHPLQQSGTLCESVFE